MSSNNFEVKVHNAQTLTEAFMTYTLFPVEVKYREVNIPETPRFPSAPHFRNIVTGAPPLQRWVTTSISERRYSELLDLRTYLVLKYPMLVFPPLPPKSSADNLNTTLQSEKHLLFQRRTIQRFLRDLMLMSHVVLFDRLVSGFLQQPREIFLQEALQQVRQERTMLSAAVSHIEDRRSLYQRPSASSTAAIIENTTKAMRSFFAYVSGTSNTNTYLEKARAKLGNDPAFQKWLPILQRVRELQISLEKSSEEFLKLLVANDATVVALENVCEPLQDYGSQLNSCEWLRQFSQEMGELSFFVQKGLSEPHVKEVDILHTHIYERIVFESSWMSAIEESIVFLLCLFTHVAEIDSDPVTSRTNDAVEYRAYLDQVSSLLGSRIDECLGPEHTRRMTHILQKYQSVSLGSLEGELQSSTGSAYFSRFLDPNNAKSKDVLWLEQTRSVPWETKR